MSWKAVLVEISAEDTGSGQQLYTKYNRRRVGGHVAGTQLIA
jgi:hypothetical protein